jgi:hypothetical protein
VGVTGGDGAVLVLRDGSGLICRARTGKPAPALGAILDTGSGISWRCVQTGQALICYDSFTDSRVAREVCASLGIRSVLAVPFKRDEEVFGLLEVLSDQPNAFSECHVQRLMKILDSAGDLLDQTTVANLQVKSFQYTESVNEHQIDPQSPLLPHLLEDAYQPPQRAHRVKVVAMIFAVLGTIGAVIWFIYSQ